MSPFRKKLDHGLIHSLTLLIFLNISFNCNINIGVQSLESGQNSLLLRPGVSSNSLSGIINLLSGSGLSSGGSGQNKIHRPNIAQPRRDRDRERPQSSRKNNDKSKNKSKTKIVTFSFSPGWRTECVYMCNRKPRGNLRFPKGRRDRPCPAEDARVVSIVNVKWCCKLDKTNALKVNSPSSPSGRRGGGARGSSSSSSGSGSESGRGGFRSDILSLLSSPRCSEPFDSAEAESQVGGSPGSAGGLSSTTLIDPAMEAEITDISGEDGNGATPTKASNSQNQITFFSNSNFAEPSGSYNYGVRPNSLLPLMSG